MLRAGPRSDPRNSPSFAALTKIDPGFKATLRLLIADIRKADDGGGDVAYYWIKALGPRAQDAVPDILACLERKSSSGVLFDKPIAALAAIGPAADLAAPTSWKWPGIRIPGTGRKWSRRWRGSAPMTRSSLRY